MDANGNLTAEGELFSYICSATGRAYDLTEYVNDTNREYTQVLTAYTVNSGDIECYSYNGNQRLSRNNIWNEARGVDHNETSYYLYDGRGSVTANTWYNGMVTNVYQYDSYGQVTYGSTKHTDFYGYNAESYNPNTGLEYLRVRYYNAESGKFFQEDTYLGDLREPLTLNRYASVLNSPLNYMDPTGHSASGRDDNKKPKKTIYDGYDEEIRQKLRKDKEAFWKDNPNYKKAKARLDEWIEEAEAVGIQVREICGSYIAGIKAGSTETRILLYNQDLKIAYGHRSESLDDYVSVDELTAYLRSVFESSDYPDAVNTGITTSRLLYILQIVDAVSGVLSMAGGSGLNGGSSGYAMSLPDGTVVVVGNEAALAGDGVWIGEMTSQNPAHGSSDDEGESKPSNKPYKNNKEANKQAQKQGYKDAHELKEDYVGKSNVSKYDMKYDTKTGEIYLESKDGKTQIPTGLIHEP